MLDCDFELNVVDERQQLDNVCLGMAVEFGWSLLDVEGVAVLDDISVWI